MFNNIFSENLFVIIPLECLNCKYTLQKSRRCKIIQAYSYIRTITVKKSMESFSFYWHRLLLFKAYGIVDSMKTVEDTPHMKEENWLN